MATTVYNVRIDEELLKRLQALAERNERTAAQEVRIAIKARLEKEAA